jgi:hypothetical protein
MFASSASFGQEPKPPKSLDAQLLEDLNRDLLEGLGAELGETSKAPPAPEGYDGRPPGPARGDLPDVVGEDLRARDAAGDNDNQLLRIEQKMRQVEERLAQRDASEGTQTLQQEIAKELAKLLEQLQQQQQNQNNSQQQQQQQQQQQSSNQQKQNQQQSAKSNPSNEPAKKAAQDSEERNGKTEEKLNPEDLQELFQKAWGNLPPQVRERMQAAMQEQFLPKYETLIEEYYQRLAEEGQR